MTVNPKSSIVKSSTVKPSTVKIGKAFRVVLPAEFREQFNLKEGEALSVEMQGSKLVLTPLREKQRAIQAKYAGRFPMACWKNCSPSAAPKPSVNSPLVFVLDASALLAYMHRERGWERVEATLTGALISSVNFAEVLSKVAERGGPSTGDGQRI